MDVWVQRSGIHGEGVVADRDLHPVEVDVIVPLVGDPTNPAIDGAGIERTFFDVEDDTAFHPGWPYAYLNHSSTPNCEVWIEDGVYFVSPLRPIAEGEELTIHYGDEWNDVP